MARTPKRPWLVSTAMIGLALLLAELLMACQNAPFKLRAPASAGAALLPSAARETVWGKVSTCPCKGDALGKVAIAIDDARIGADFGPGPSNPEYRYFSIRFDPRVVPRTRIVEIIEANGGSIVDGPPAGADGGWG
jgi:hypothetical protein